MVWLGLNLGVLPHIAIPRPTCPRGTFGCPMPEQPILQGVSCRLAPVLPRLRRRWWAQPRRDLERHRMARRGSRFTPLPAVECVVRRDSALLRHGRELEPSVETASRSLDRHRLASLLPKDIRAPRARRLLQCDFLQGRCILRRGRKCRRELGLPDQAILRPLERWEMGGEGHWADRDVMANAPITPRRQPRRGNRDARRHTGPVGHEASSTEPTGDGGRLASPFQSPPTPVLVDLHRFYVASGTPSGVLAWMSQRPPAGSKLADRGHDVIWGEEPHLRVADLWAGLRRAGAPRRCRLAAR